MHANLLKETRVTRFCGTRRLTSILLVSTTDAEEKKSFFFLLFFTQIFPLAVNLNVELNFGFFKPLALTCASGCAHVKSFCVLFQLPICWWWGEGWGRKERILLCVVYLVANSKQNQTVALSFFFCFLFSFIVALMNTTKGRKNN